MLTVRSFQNQKETADKNFDRAWFRLSNEETNQTIDYSLISKIDTPEDYQEVIPNDEDEEALPF